MKNSSFCFLVIPTIFAVSINACHSTKTPNNPKEAISIPCDLSLLGTSLTETTDSKVSQKPTSASGTRPTASADLFDNFDAMEPLTLGPNILEAEAKQNTASSQNTKSRSLLSGGKKETINADNKSNFPILQALKQAIAIQQRLAKKVAQQNEDQTHNNNKGQYES